MKKLGLIKRIGLTATTLFVCLAMLITCFTFTAPRAVLAEGENEPVAPSTLGPISVANNVKVKDTYNYGDMIAVPEDATVIAPNGDTVEVTGGKVEATQLGVYKISYTEDSVTYDFKVSVKLAEEYFLYIEYNGADIPTYAEKNRSFKLPKAYVKYYDKNNILQEYPGDYTVDIEDSWGNTYNGEDKTFNPNRDGKVFITYTATLGNTGTKRLSKTFTVNVQASVNKSGNPSLAVSGISKDASVNRPVTLPVAKVSDNNDDNIKVIIEVLDPNGNPVNNVKVNDDGYAYETKENDPVMFDNDKSMTFYPTETGKYKVRYTAENDFENKSSTSESIIEVADHVAPVFKNTDKYEYLIPETWGMEVKNEAGDSVATGGKIKFLIPEVVDNKCHMPVGEEDKDNLISIYFRVTDSDNNKTILTITNILSTGSDGKFDKNDVYTEDATFNNEEKAFTFDFSKYAKKDSKDKDKDAPKPGTYTVLFRARDKDNNTSSKTYTITLKDTYEDKDKPSEAKVTAPEYISAADESFTIPYPVYADAEDTRPYVVYRLYTDAEKYIDVKGGEEASLTAKAGYIVVNEGKDNEKELQLGDNLYYYLGVTDKAGNFRSNAVADDKSFVNVAENPAEYAKTTAVTKVITETDSDEKFSFVGNIQFVNAAEGSTNTTLIYAGDGNVVNAGSFVITAAEDMRYYTGFEVSVLDPDGDYVNVTLETLSDVKDGKAKIYVQNIRFTPTVPTKKAGEDEEKPYVMTIRVFDVNGNNSVYGYKLTGVNAKDNGLGQTSAITNVPKNGNVNVKYKLQNSVITHITGNRTYRVVRKIRGGIFSLMGNEFTAKTAGTFDIQDGYIDADKIVEDSGFSYSDVEFNFLNEGNYYVNIVDDSKPVIELQGKMPTYKEKYNGEGEYTETNGLVKLPVAVAYTENGMGEVKVEVIGPDDKKAEMVDDYTFKANLDGTYKVTYTGTYENGDSDEAVYYISVGDVLAPQFTLTGGTSTSSSKKQGDTFKFKTIELVAGEESDGVTVTKEIALGTDVISGTTVSGSYSGYSNKANNGSEIKLDKAGTYTVTYTATDKAHNSYKITETFTVSSEGSSTATTWTTLSTVLIVVAIVLLAGVVIYVVRFRKVKK